MPASGDPVGVGLAKSLARPGGSVTGLTSLNSELIAKRLQLLKEAFPAIRRVGVLIDPSTGLSTQWSVAENAAPSLGVTLDLLRVQRAADLSVAFDRAVRQRDEALVVGAGTVAVEMYAPGLSTRDIEAAFRDAKGASVLTPHRRQPSHRAAAARVRSLRRPRPQ